MSNRVLRLSEEEIPEEELSPEERRRILKKLQEIALEIAEEIRKGDYIVTNDYTLEELKDLLKRDD